MKNRAITIAGQLRAREEAGAPVIEGYFALFGVETQLWPGAYEEIAPGAFDIEDVDVRALVNHDTTLVLGRTAAGTLALSLDEKGLFGAITVNQDDSDAMNLHARVKRGDVTQCSFGFDILEEDTDYREDGTAKFILRKVQLHEVSVCTFPAYEDTGVQVRKKQVEDHRRQLLERRKKTIIETRLKKWH